MGRRLAEGVDAGGAKLQSTPLRAHDVARAASARCSRSRSSRASSSARCTGCSGWASSLTLGPAAASSTSRTSAFAFLAAYLCYQLASVGGIDPLLTLALIVPLFFALGVGLHWVMARFAVTPFNSLLLTFGLTGIIEAGIQCDLDRRLPQARVALRRTEVQRRRAVRAGAGADHAGARGRARRFGDLGGAALHRPRQGDARRWPRTRRSPRPSASTRSARAAARRHLRRARRRRRRLPRADASRCAVADLRLDRRRVRRGDAGRPGQRARAAGRRHRDRRQRGGDHGGRRRRRGRRSSRSRC